MERQGTSSSSSSEQPSDANEPKYTGVRKRKWGKWVSEIRLPNSRERIWLGSYDTPEKAARAFDAALYCLRGRSAKFNFPGNIPDIVGGQSLSPQQIQLVAARYANEEPTTTTTTTSFDPHLLHAPNLEQQQQQHCVASSSDGARPVDGDTTIDWSFYDMLDNIGGDFYKPPSPSTSIEDVREDEAYNSHYPSFLWNF